MPVRLFVYGTLKAGFPNAHLNPGRRLPGRYLTAERLPLLVVRLPREARAPWLVHQPGEGHRVWGELVEIDEAALAEVDRFEEVGLPGGYQRVPLLLVREGDGERVEAFAYLKSPAQRAQCLAEEGPFEAYTPELAAGYWIRTA